jgi:hypothetical protein
MENARPTFSGKDKDQKVGTLIFCHFSIIEMIYVEIKYAIFLVA